MELSALAHNRARAITREVEVVVGDQTMAAVIRPLGMSPATQVRLLHVQRAAEAGNLDAQTVEDILTVMPQALSELVVSWDAQLDGEPVPPTADALSRLPIDVLQVLMEAVQEAASTVPFETK